MAVLAPRRAAAASLDELLARADIWRGKQLAGSEADGVSTGFAGLDAALPGAGWPPGALVEILGQGSTAQGGADARRQCSGSGEFSLLLPVLARHTQAGGWVVLVAPPLRPHAPALAAAGIDLSHLIVVDADAGDRLWVIDRTLRSAAVHAVLAWLPQVDAQALRRLQLSAEESGTTLFAFRPQACAVQASPAPLRLTVAGAADGAEIRILKRRGPPLARPLAVPLARPIGAVVAAGHSRRGGRVRAPVLGLELQGIAA